MARFPLLNDSQLNVLAKKLSTNKQVDGVQGPPGTGKSVVAAYIACSKASEGSRVLCLAYENRSIDQLGSYILSLLAHLGRSLGLQSPHKTFRRVGFTPRISLEMIPYHCSYRNARDKRIVASTVYSSRRLPNSLSRLEELAKQGFDTLIIEESGQIPSHQAWIALGNLRKEVGSVIVIGDDKQIFPQSPNFTKERSILFNLRRVDPGTVDMLEITYRLPNPGLTMTSTLFYEGRLRAPYGIRNRRLEWSWGRLPEHIPYSEALDPENSLFYLGVMGDRDEWYGLSFVNRAQASVALRLSSTYLERGYPPDRIVLMAPYSAQVEYVKKRLRECDLPVTCTTVHGMLGSENDVIILMTTRSNQNQDLGFLKFQPEILNVGTTRHRCKLIIVGDNHDTFSDGSRASRYMFDFMDRQGLMGWVSAPSTH